MSTMKLGFALEYSLGHITHAQNLKQALAGDDTVEPVYVDLPYDGMPGRWAGLPGIRSNWSLRASLGARLGLRRHRPSLRAALFHTQVTSLLSADFMRAVPSIVSLDATPLQYDALGAFYGHTSGSARLEAVKKRLNTRAFDAARHLVTWSDWAKRSLVDDYRIAAEKVTVLPPGIDTKRWESPDRQADSSRQVRLLFVGGDFARKGGETLISAFSNLQSKLPVHLDIVSSSPGAAINLPNVTVHRGITPNSDTLVKLYAGADIFVFPSRGDCLPLAVMEAMAAGLPVISTNVGALPEAVVDGETGLIVPTDDPRALADAITRLIHDAGFRVRLGRQARESALARFNAATNYGRLIALVKGLAD